MERQDTSVKIIVPRTFRRDCQEAMRVSHAAVGKALGVTIDYDLTADEDETTGRQNAFADRLLALLVEQGIGHSKAMRLLQRLCWCASFEGWGEDRIRDEITIAVDG